MNNNNSVSAGRGVPVLMECYRDAELQRAMFHPRLSPNHSVGLWGPQLLPIKDQHRPIPVHIPHRQHGPPWYPNTGPGPHNNCNVYPAPQHCNPFTLKPREMYSPEAVYSAVQPHSYNGNNNVAVHIRPARIPEPTEKQRSKRGRPFKNRTDRRTKSYKEVNKSDTTTKKPAEQSIRMKDDCNKRKQNRIRKDIRKCKQNKKSSKQHDKETTPKLRLLVKPKNNEMQKALEEDMHNEDLFKKKKVVSINLPEEELSIKDREWNSAAMKHFQMSSPNKTDDEKSLSSLKRSANSDEPKSNNALHSTPTQLYKTGTVTDEGSPEGRRSESTSSSSGTPSTILIGSSTSSSTGTRGSTLSAESKSFEPGSQNSSVYETPECSPSALRTPTVLIRSRIKRSLIDHYDKDDQSSANSSLDCSYYTPDSSPGEYVAVKRLRTRWSLPVNLQDPDTNKSYSGPLFTCAKDDLQPELIGYQMVGDSQFCRFGQQLLGLERVATPNSSGRIGICVSGQTITDLHRRVKEKIYPISDKIILMIGTNDFLRSVDVMTMCKELSDLIKTLQETVTNIVLLTLPPIPKLERKQSTLHFNLLEKYNSFIRSLADGDHLRIADISPLYMSSPPYQRCRMHLFELFFAGPARRYDMIHLNRQGLEVIRKYILDNFL